MATEVQEPAPVLPALEVLQADQRQLLGELADGFADQRGAVEWYQRAAVRTFGHVADEWPPGALEYDRALLGWLTGSGHEPDRQRVAQGAVLPACLEAYRELRTVAGEYGTGGLEESERLVDVDPAAQRDVAMRPGFQVLDAKQRRALAELWAGFDSRGALIEWLHGLNSPSYGEVEPALARHSVFDDLLVADLLGPERSRSDRRARNRFAIAVLLPAFVRGAGRLEAGELARSTRTELEVPQG